MSEGTFTVKAASTQPPAGLALALAIKADSNSGHTANKVQKGINFVVTATITEGAIPATADDLDGYT